MHYSSLLLSVCFSLLVCGGVQSAPSCPSACACRWKSGKEMVRCSGVASLPKGIASTTLILDLSGNKLLSLPAETFPKAQLFYLQKIYLSHCQLKTIHATAFAQVSNLVELDLSDNELTRVPSDSFVHFPNLRRLNLAGNPLSRIDANAFVPLGILASLELSHCHLEIVDNEAFVGLEGLTLLKLDGNLLRTLSGDIVSPLNLVNALLLQDNPWHCDCQLRALHRWFFDRHLHQTAPLPVCAEPPQVQGKVLTELNEEDLSCRPRGAYVHRRVEVFEGNNAILLCKVTAYPEAQIEWQWKGGSIANLSFVNPSARLPFLIKESGTTNKTSALHITDVTQFNAGKYICLANNVAGRFALTISLIVTIPPETEVGVHVGLVIAIFLIAMTSTMLIVVICALLIKQRPLRAKHLKYLSLRALHRSLQPGCNQRFECAEAAEQNKVKHNAMEMKGCVLPDTVTCTVKDFDVPLSSRHFAQTQEIQLDDVHIHDIEPPDGLNWCNRSDSCNSCNSSCHDYNTLEAKCCSNKDDDNNKLRDNKRNSACFRGGNCPSESQSDSDSNIQPKFSQPYPSNQHDCPEDVEMKVQLDHMSAESMWKQNNLSNDCGQHHHPHHHHMESALCEAPKLVTNTIPNIYINDKLAATLNADISRKWECDPKTPLSSLEAYIPPSLSPIAYPPNLASFMFDPNETNL